MLWLSPGTKVSAGGGALFPGGPRLLAGYSYYARPLYTQVPPLLHPPASEPARAEEKKNHPAGHLDLPPSESCVPPCALALSCPNRLDLFIPPSLSLEHLPNDAPWKSSMKSAPQVFLSRNALWKSYPHGALWRGPPS